MPETLQEGLIVKSLNEAKKDNMQNAARKGFSTATDLADYLVRKGIAFRDAHELVGQAVALCVQKKM